jgi:hypothetical protein
MKNKYQLRKIFVGCTLLILCSTGCKKFIEVDSPVTSVNEGNVYTNDNTAISVLTAIYAEMSTNYNGQFGLTSLSLFPELSSDNLSLADITNENCRPYYENELNSNGNVGIPPYWAICYQFIYTTNAAIEGLNRSSELTPAVKTQLIGEAYFIRAFMYFHLVNLYGDVPLALSTNYVLNSKLPRTAKSDVYQQIISDLKQAQSNLNNDYIDVTLIKKSIERIRPNRTSATAMLARTYLYAGDNVNAELSATEVISHNAMYQLEEPDKTFLKASKETIWSLQPVILDFNTWEARQFILPSTGPDFDFPFYLSDQLIRKFEPNDKRLEQWTGNVLVGSKKYYYASKYKAGTSTTLISEFSTVLRLGEQYLIRAEARAKQEKLIGVNSASSDVNTIRNRAGLLPITSTTKDAILADIINERQKELFTEWGHRWFDLKRTDKINEVMTMVMPLKKPGGTWKNYMSLYPIPQSEINRNPALKGMQNLGY